MFFTDAIVKLSYTNSNKAEVFNQLETHRIYAPSEVIPEHILIIQKNNELQLIKDKEAKEKLAKEKNAIIYIITKQQYHRLTDGREPLLNPAITDRLGIRLASSFASNMAKIIALFLTAALMPIINIVAVPLVFALAYLILHSIRYRSAFGRWPNKREYEHLLGYAFAAGMEMSFAMILFSLFSGASIFAPISIHLASLITLPFGGPLVTYLIMPLIMATIISVGVTLFNLARVLITHFFDIRFQFSSRFPFFFTIKLKSDRDSLVELGKKLLITAIKEFTVGMITSLISIYLSYIPAGLLVGYASKAVISASTSAIFTVSMQVVGALINSLIIALALDRLFDKKLFPKISQTWDNKFGSKLKKMGIIPTEDTDLSVSSKPSSTTSKAKSSSLGTPTTSSASMFSSNRKRTITSSKSESDLLIDSDAPSDSSKSSTRVSKRLDSHGMFNQTGESTIESPTEDIIEEETPRIGKGSSEVKTNSGK